MKVSIITINKNNPDGLQATIDSVLNQRDKNFEFIVIDGGSGRRDLEVIIENQANITKWVSEEDRGIYNAMNKGVRLATGEYCFFFKLR